MRRPGLLAIVGAALLLLAAGCDAAERAGATPPGPARQASIPSQDPASLGQEPDPTPSPAEVVAAPHGERPEAVPEGAQSGIVERIVDGDTIWVRVDQPGGPLVADATHKIRLLEIDTPETRHPSLGKQCGGDDATAFAAEQLPVGSEVWLLADQEDTDRYGRFLRYVWTGEGDFFNDEAVRSGHARASLYEPNDAYIEQLRAAEAEAQSAARGIWGPPCALAAEDLPSDTPDPTPPADTAAGGPSRACDASYPTLCLRSSPDLNCRAIAENAFPVTGSDPHNLDGDGDGVGCQS